MFGLRNRIRFASLLFLLSVAPLVCQKGQAVLNAQVKGHERQVKLEGQGNFRDLGGYKTADGRTVKWGLIYRAGQLSQLTDADLSKLQDLTIRTVVDLRGPAEIERGRDRVPQGVRDVSYPIDVTRIPRKEEPASSASAAAPANSMLQITQSIMVSRADVYSALIRELADPQNRPLVFHCTAGKDRTGVGAAIVLSLLGVPWETVREDYLLSNYYRQAENERDMNNLRNDLAKRQGIPPEKVDRSNYEGIYYVKPPNIWMPLVKL